MVDSPEVIARTSIPRNHRPMKTLTSLITGAGAVLFAGGMTATVVNSPRSSASSATSRPFSQIAIPGWKLHCPRGYLWG